MRAHLVQLDIAWEDKQANYDKVERLIARADPDEGDLVVLPEMFDTGLSLEVERTADADDATLRYLIQLAADHKIWVQGARTTLKQGETHGLNLAPVAGPRGLVCEFAKVHPFTFGREPEKFVGGFQVLTYPWGDQRPTTVCPAICYDLRFPELFRIGLLKGAELFAIGANWPEARQHHWRALLIARAIENQAYVLGVNRAGQDPGVKYAGGTIAIGPRGEVIGELGGEEGVLSVEIDAGEVRSWRDKFPAWKDLKLFRLRD